MALRLRIPGKVQPGRHVIAVDLRYGSWTLPQFTEAIIAI
jgi:hypothetical protein